MNLTVSHINNITTKKKKLIQVTFEHFIYLEWDVAKGQKELQQS